MSFYVLNNGLSVSNIALHSRDIRCWQTSARTSLKVPPREVLSLLLSFLLSVVVLTAALASKRDICSLKVEGAESQPLMSPKKCRVRATGWPSNARSPGKKRPRHKHQCCYNAKDRVRARGRYVPKSCNRYVCP